MGGSLSPAERTDLPFRLRKSQTVKHMAGSSAKTTTDHKTIRQWAEQRGGKPARARGTEGGEGAGVLRIEFQDKDDSLEPISWDDFFDTFEKKKLAFLYQEEQDGGESRFHKLVSRD